uniref:Acyl_transf_3 domain-containing protein n=1 Tax=Macrostomum lignano TaxID=282301 RepID=A0A1I8F519_9PLAT
PPRSSLAASILGRAEASPDERPQPKTETSALITAVQCRQPRPPTLTAALPDTANSVSASRVTIRRGGGGGGGSGDGVSGGRIGGSSRRGTLQERDELLLLDRVKLLACYSFVLLHSVGVGRAGRHHDEARLAPGLLGASFFVLAATLALLPACALASRRRSLARGRAVAPSSASAACGALVLLGDAVWVCLVFPLAGFGLCWHRADWHSCHRAWCCCPRLAGRLRHPARLGWPSGKLAASATEIKIASKTLLHGSGVIL